MIVFATPLNPDETRRSLRSARLLVVFTLEDGDIAAGEGK